MSEIKIRFHSVERGWCREIWEVFTEPEKPRRYIARDSEGRGTWGYISDPDGDPGFPTSDNMTLILCDKNWNEHTRTSNDRTRFPEFFPTLIDACREQWNAFAAKPLQCLDTPDFWKWISAYTPKGLLPWEEHNWQNCYQETAGREVLMPFDYCGDHLAIVRVTRRHTECDLEWRMYHVDSLDEEEAGNYAHFYGYEVGNYIIGTNPLKIANLPCEFQSGETTVSITAEDVGAFNAMIGKRGQAPFQSGDPKVQHLISLLKQEAARHNEGLAPSIDKDDYCETCGSRSGECHPKTGYCFVCDTDNWEPVNYRDL